jgi:hypothetical protein
VRMDGGAAVATLPDLALANTRNGGSIELGTITITQSEAAPGRVRYAGDLPRQIRFTERTGAAPLVITAGGGGVTIVRDVAASLIREVDFRITDLAVPPPMPGAVDTAIGLLQIGGSITDRADGLSDATAGFRMQNVRGRAPRNGAGTTVGELAFSVGAQGFRLADFERLRSALADAQKAPAVEQVGRTFSALMAFGVASVTTETRLADGVFFDGGASPAVTVARFAARDSLGSWSQPEASYQTRYEVDGLVVRPDMTPVPQYIPSHAVVSLAVERLPLQAIIQAAAGMRPSPGAGAASLITPQFMDMLLGSGATLRIAPIELVSQALGAALNGSVSVNAQSPLRAVANGDLVIRGLDAVLRELSGPSQAGRTGDSPAVILAMLSALGQQGTGSAGQPTRTYHIEVTPAGQLMLNGTDMSALLGSMGGGPARPGRPPAPPQAPGK